jgi:hypothetical protein
MTNKIRKQIDTELSDMNLSSEVIHNIKKGKKSIRTKNYALVLPIILVCVISFSTVYAVSQIFTMKVNHKEIPQLDSMSIIKVNDIEDAQIKDGIISKEYNDMQELENELGVKFLSSKLENNHYHLIKYTKIGKGYNCIDIGAYIVGDLTNLVYQEEYSYYSWDSGIEYQTPIDLKIEIISDNSQQPFDTEYLGTFHYLNTFISKDGYTINLLESKSLGKNQICAIFVANGIRYTLTGHVEASTMIEIVNSMK